MKISVRTQDIKLSVIIPVLNEESMIASSLGRLPLSGDREIEVIVVDGGSSDHTVEIAQSMCDQVLVKTHGRALQMNHGARQARGDLLLFLHADSLLPSNFFEILKQSMEQDCIWGRFDIRLSGEHPLFRIIEFCINVRSRVSGVATGDQGIFVKRSVFEKIGGFPKIEIMEDIALSKKLKRLAWPICVREQIVTSSRRWEQKGILRTVLLMWALRLFYFLGAKPAVLARWYR